MNIKLFFVQVFVPDNPSHFGAFYTNKYDAACCVISFIDQETLPAEDDILEMHDGNHTSFRSTDGTTICEGSIDDIEFRIVEVSSGDKISILI